MQVPACFLQSPNPAWIMLEKYFQSLPYIDSFPFLNQKQSCPKTSLLGKAVAKHHKTIKTSHYTMICSNRASDPDILRNRSVLPPVKKEG